MQVVQKKRWKRWSSLIFLIVGCFVGVVRSDEWGDDGEEFGGDDYDDPYGGMDPYGGGYGGGYGDDEYGGGGPTEPAYEVLDTLEDVTSYLEQGETEAVVLGFFDEEGTEDALDVFKDTAEQNRYDFKFAYTTNDQVKQKYKYNKAPVVTVFLPKRFVSEKYGDKTKARFPSAKLTSAESLAKFLYKKSLPLVGEKTWKSNQRYEKQAKPILTLYASIDLEKNPKGFEYFANRLRKVAIDHKDTILFNIANKDDFSYILDDYDFENKLEGKKTVGVGINDDDKYYKMTTSFNVDNLRAFVADFIAGKLTPKIKETPDYDMPSDTDDDTDNEQGEDMYEGSSVISLTSENFDHVTSGKDAFLEFYAPWCGHCQSLKPTYKKLAKELADTDGVVVAAMDATAHTPPSDFDVSGYPTIFFKPKDGKPMPYDGDRDLSSMLDFVKKHGKSSAIGEL
uniref:protein disulfide-isomerase n=1 Tax=Aureoumbra lagunensis TaxID=44058 RepID=A0A7S3JT45_9STRA|mmetsp:Transcript_7648/g.10637  ORF Transcript_7648/g.10637 Transcript_7648/m.10637 type:complete len:452 (-) Transcript_7648:406-1761(-)|eukprot:CAMPEP_0197288052 /NCGR_PEP_ID=MMETSP0890-20130614/4958_1 /TAXON_ID=44058 ORGANISM="Aureoumbra lagunensis, Strain CCMP1510" /NCGR_SAMPLE_ID=MMETSP0890 /ASSEMBLY_ACC=CAM_ASM_000533 /LENGTH=451 /DNA_ID=CAMNT_0042758435 /DNA_START=21 /DNA_END=1376 /DNA_ORIENTATION=-